MDKNYLASKGYPQNIDVVYSDNHTYQLYDTYLLYHWHTHYYYEYQYIEWMYIYVHTEDKRIYYLYLDTSLTDI